MARLHHQSVVRWCTGRGGGWFALSYLLDWLVSAAVLILNVSFTQFWWDPSVRFLPDNFQTLQYPLDPEVLPTWVIGMLTMILPVSIFLVFQIALRSAHDFHHACLGFFETLVFNYLFNSSLQYLSGKYTPDWYDRLRTGTPEIIKHGRLSYPSWHVSTTFASMGFFSMYLAGKLGLFRKNSGHSWKAVIVLVPLFGAALIAITRTLDYHSDFDDVTAGTLLGLLMAKFFYSCNFHSLSSNRSHLPLTRNANAMRKNPVRADALRASVDAAHERLPVRLDAQQIGDDDDDEDEDEEGSAF